MSPDLAPKHDREAILALIAEDARRLEAGKPSICAGCQREIQSRLHTYRCTECGLPFHLPCARRHFEESADPVESEAREAMDDETALCFPIRDGGLAELCDLRISMAYAVEHGGFTPKGLADELARLDHCIEALRATPTEEPDDE